MPLDPFTGLTKFLKVPLLTVLKLPIIRADFIWTRLYTRIKEVKGKSDKIQK
jgi:hypothetical protein